MTESTIDLKIEAVPLKRALTISCTTFFLADTHEYHELTVIRQQERVPRTMAKVGAWCSESL